MINEERQICKACATGNEKHPHNGDMLTCIKGREEYIRQLSPKEQIRAMIIHERLSHELAEHIMLLAEARGMTPLDLAIAEGVSFLGPV